MTLIVDSDLNGASPQFTFTCISTGGPATTVTWTRDSILVIEGTETVLDDPVTARYTHALTVSGREGGLYRCTVANEKPSSDTAEYNMWGMQSFQVIIIVVKACLQCQSCLKLWLDRDKWCSPGLPNQWIPPLATPFPVLRLSPLYPSLCPSKDH